MVTLSWARNMQPGGNSHECVKDSWNHISSRTPGLCVCRGPGGLDGGLPGGQVSQPDVCRQTFTIPAVPRVLLSLASQFGSSLKPAAFSGWGGPLAAGGGGALVCGLISYSSFDCRPWIERSRGRLGVSPQEPTETKFEGQKQNASLQGRGGGCIGH